jgi:hypothetical protein
MSADMMIICEEDNSGYDGNSGLAFFVDETSMGDPWNEFGKWFQSRFCGAPGLFEQLNGIKEHNFTEITGADVVAIEYALSHMECHKNLDKPALVAFIHNHTGKHISTENW